MIPEIIAHLQANTASFPTIENAWMMKPVEDLSAAVPAIYLFPAARSGKPGLGETTCYRQHITKQVKHFIVCNPGDFESLWVEVWNALCGFQVDSYYDGLEFVDGDTEKITGQYLWWWDIYRTSRIHTKSE